MIEAEQVVIRSRGTTWGYLHGAPPPWPADCSRCGRQVGVYGEADVDRMSDEIFRHVARCTWWWDLARLTIRRRRG